MDSRTACVAVIGATGNVGRKLVEALLRKGVAVRAIASGEAKLAALKTSGAEVSAGDVQDTRFLTKALEGSAAVFAMLPEHPTLSDFHADKRRSAESISESIRKSQVSKVVALSAIGAIHPGGIGPARSNCELDQMLETIPNLSTVILRGAFLMENHLASIGLIKTAGINGTPARTDVAFPTVSTQDIATAAAEYLSNPEFDGRIVCDLLGPRDYNYREITSILGAAIGKPDLQYMQFPYGEFHRGVVASGLAPELADALLELYTALNEGSLQKLVQRNGSNATPTTLEEFAREVFRPAYAAA